MEMGSVEMTLFILKERNIEISSQINSDSLIVFTFI